MKSETVEWASLLAQCWNEVIRDVVGEDSECGTHRRVFPEAAFRITLQRGTGGRTDLTCISGGIPDILPDTLQRIALWNKKDVAGSATNSVPVAVVFRGKRREDLCVFYECCKAKLVLHLLPEERRSKILLLPVDGESPILSGTLGGGEVRIEFPALEPGNYLVVLYSLINSEALQRRALHLRRNHCFSQALALLEEVLEADPTNYTALTRKGCVLRQMGRSEEAKATVEAALRIEPDCALAWRAKGALLRDESKHQEGLDCYLRSLQLDRTDHLCWENKGNALLSLGMGADAAEAYATAHEVKKLYPEERF